MPSIADKRRTFHDLHRSGCFVIPNPWDIGTARYLQHIGAKALATTSSGFAFSQAAPDGAISRDAMLTHFRELVDATDVPVNADFEYGHAHAPDALAENVRLCIETGVAGLSIEDATGEEAKPIYDFDDAVARMKAARGAIDKAGGDVLLVGRAEGFLHGRPDLDDAIARLKAFINVGADCLYAPGLRTPEQIAAVVQAVAPKPVNVLISFAGEHTVESLGALGVRRISVGGGLARVAWGGFMRAAKTLLENGRFDGFAGAPANAELNRLFADDLAKRSQR